MLLGPLPHSTFSPPAESHRDPPPPARGLRAASPAQTPCSRASSAKAPWTAGLPPWLAARLRELGPVPLPPRCVHGHPRGCSDPRPQDFCGCTDAAHRGHTWTHTRACPRTRCHSLKAGHDCGFAALGRGRGSRGRQTSAEAPGAHGTYHHSMDVICFLQSRFLAFFAFSLFVFCKHNTWERSVRRSPKA